MLVFLTILNILLSAAIVYGLFAYIPQLREQDTTRMSADNERTRRSCAESADRAIRSEARRAEADLDIIEQVREMMKTNHRESA